MPLFGRWPGCERTTGRCIIDLVVASVLMSMGMVMLPSVVVSLPLKLIFFVLIDGWNLVAGSMVQSYGP
jgi:flagellar biosynthetic protein FliP